MARGKETAEAKRAELQHALAGLDSEDTSMVVSGSLARDEVTISARDSLFSVDYMRDSRRSSALMELPVIYVFTHDSIGVGEDGPTHQLVEQLAHMRAIAGQIVRPAGAE